MSERTATAMAVSGGSHGSTSAGGTCQVTCPQASRLGGSGTSAPARWVIPSRAVSQSIIAWGASSAAPASSSQRRGVPGSAMAGPDSIRIVRNRCTSPASPSASSTALTRAPIELRPVHAPIVVPCRCCKR